MKLRLLFLALLILFLLPVCSYADIHMPVDTIAFTVTSAEPELDPNSNNYCFTFKGTANGTPWKLQMDYYAESEYGIITNAEFRLPNEGGSSTNWIRKDDGSYKTYYGYSLEANVAASTGKTTVDLKGLYRERVTATDTLWHYVEVHADIADLVPTAVHEIDLGQVAVVPNTFLGYLIMEAQNDDYSLAFGVSGIKELRAGTFYRTELIRPDFVDRSTGDTIVAKYAQLEVRDSTATGLFQLALDLYDADRVLYRLAMHTDAIVATDTMTIDCTSSSLVDVEAMYGMYQFVGTNSDYQVAFAVKPGIIHNSELVIPNDSVDLSYTQVLRLSDNSLIRVQQAEGTIEIIEQETITKQVVKAQLIGTDNVLYDVTFNFGDSDLPQATDTTFIECGDHVGRLDYTHGPGYLGLVLGNEEADVHIVVHNNLQMKGVFTSDSFVYKDATSDKAMSYVTTYSDDDSVIRFTDIQAAEMRMDSIGNIVDINLDVVTIASRMYRFHARLLPTAALTGNEVNYVVDNPAVNDGMMVAFRLSKVGDTSSFRLQFQRSDEWDEEGQISGNNYEIWDFAFEQDQVDGITGSYGYAAGTLSEDYSHIVVENGMEIYLKPMAGTLTLATSGTVTIPAEVLGFEYHTHLYSVEAHLAMENGMIYNVTGENYLLCVDYNTGDFVEFSEQQISAIDQVLKEQGYSIRKVFRNGTFLIEKDKKNFDLLGR